MNRYASLLIVFIILCIFLYFYNLKAKSINLNSKQVATTIILSPTSTYLPYPDQIDLKSNISMKIAPLTGWKRRDLDNGNTITLSKSGYVLSITSNVFKGDFWWEHAGICFFPDTPGYQNKQSYKEPVGAYEIPKYTEIETLNGNRIRHGKATFSSQPKANASEMVCYEDGFGSQESYTQASAIGYVTIDYPSGNPKPALIKEIDQILTTLHTF